MSGRVDGGTRPPYEAYECGRVDGSAVHAFNARMIQSE